MRDSTLFIRDDGEAPVVVCLMCILFLVPKSKFVCISKGLIYWGYGAGNIAYGQQLFVKASIWGDNFFFQIIYTGQGLF